MDFCREDIIKLYNYLHINENDRNIIDIYNNYMLYDNQINSYLHNAGFEDNFIVFNSISNTYRFYIKSNGSALNAKINYDPRFNYILRDMIRYVKYKNRKDIIESL